MLSVHSSSNNLELPDILPAITALLNDPTKVLTAQVAINDVEETQQPLTDIPELEGVSEENFTTDIQGKQYFVQIMLFPIYFHHNYSYRLTRRLSI